MTPTMIYTARLAPKYKRSGAFDVNKDHTAGSNKHLHDRDRVQGVADVVVSDTKKERAQRLARMLPERSMHVYEAIDDAALDLALSLRCWETCRPSAAHPRQGRGKFAHRQFILL